MSSNPFPATGYPPQCMEALHLFHEVTISHGILLGGHEILKTSQMVFPRVVTHAMVQEILHSFHSDHTSSHLGVTKTLEKILSRVCWPGQKRDVALFVSSSIALQKRTSPSKK